MCSLWSWIVEAYENEGISGGVFLLELVEAIDALGAGIPVRMNPGV